MKNIIQNNDPNLTISNKIRDLTAKIEHLKNQQVPTIRMTSESTVTFVLPPYNRATNDKADSTALINMQLIPPNSQILFAVPEVDLFGDSTTTPTKSATSVWPSNPTTSTGQPTNWSTPTGNSTSFYDMDVWYDAWSSEGLGDLTAKAFIRSRGPYTMNCLFVVRWRYITPNSTI